MSFITILTHTPTWVFGLFAALVALGVSQCVKRQATLYRVALMPLTMTALSAAGLISVFGAQAQPLLLWAVAAAASGIVIFNRPAPAGTLYDATKRQFTLPGSFVPLLLIMSIFCTKYGVNASLAMRPELAHQFQFAAVVSAIYGGFSGIFVARAARLWKLAAQGRTAALSTLRHR